MCGIAGIIERSLKVESGVLETMKASLSHRGPDGEGVSIDGNCGFVHTRLSIIDLSTKAQQPMRRGNFVITFNGEIYNYKEIKRELEREGCKFSTDSDTEVLLRAYEWWGVQGFNRLRGMFAFAIFNTQTKETILCRDRVGVKPLFYCHSSDRLLFASEVRAIITHPYVKKKLNFSALGTFLQRGYIQSPDTIYEGIYSVEPGTVLMISSDLKIRSERFWTVPVFVENSSETEQHTLVRLEELLCESFAYRQVADVPTGVFLSGGVDSSLVVALLQKNSQKQLNTFTVGFEDSAYDEAPYAQAVANYIGTNHYEHYCSQKDAKDIVPLLSSIYDQPIGDVSAIPTYLLSTFARSHVKVALSADGGDELFGGYRRYAETERLFSLFAHVPDVLQTTLHETIRTFIQKILPQHSFITKKAELCAELILRSGNFKETYRYLRSRWTDQEVFQLLRECISLELEAHESNGFPQVAEVGTLNQMQATDFRTYLPDNILVKTDRASMAVGLEVREPFLDHKVVEYACSISPSFRRKDGESKYVLKKVLKDYLPREMVERPKQGFSVPIATWLRGDLRYLIDEYLSEKRISQEGLLNDSMVKDVKTDFLDHKGSPARIWNLLILQMWKERWNI